MATRYILGLMILSLALSVSGVAGGKEDLQKYFNETARKVKEAADPAQKREILSESFQTMTKALDAAESAPLLADGDRAGLGQYKAALQEKQDELAGRNGFDRVADGQLNAFSEYVVQDMEQADQNISISLVSALLILILLVLIL